MTEHTQSGSPSQSQVRDSSRIPSADTALGKLIFVIALLLAGSAIYYLATRPIEQVRYTNIHLIGVLTLYLLVSLYRFFDQEERALSEKLTVTGLSLALLAGIFGSLYIEAFYYELQYERFTRYTTPDMLAGLLLIVALLVAVYHAFGWVITAVAVFTLIFAVYGDYFPGILHHGGISPDRLIVINTLEFSGVYHFIFQIGATWIFIFIIWAGIVEEFGGLEYFIDLGYLVGSRFRSGVAQTAVVSSMVMGSISGSPMANIVVTGSFTIPLMKDRGINPGYAGAIESVASCGGMILPPIMGSVAFLMANFLRYTYGEIIVIAALPALLFYAVIALSVHLIVIKQDVDMTVEREFDTRRVAKGIFPVAVSVVGLVYMLIGLNYPPGYAGVWTIVVLIGAKLGSDIAYTREPVTSLKEVVIATARGLRTGSIRMLSIALILAVMGVVISTFTMTGTGHRLSLSIVDLSGGNVILLLALVMISSIILGFGMPTTAAYLLTITLVAPAMIEAGFEPVTAHFYVFYFAMLATLTPPIALSATVAAEVAQADFVDVALKAVYIAIPLFLLPYVFAFNQNLLILEGYRTVVAFAISFVGLVLFTFGLQGGSRLFRGRSALAVRTVFIGVGFAIIFVPGLVLFAN